MSKLLLYAKASTKDIILRAPAGNSDGMNILVTSNSVWKAETTSDWLTLSSTDDNKGAGVVDFTYTQNTDKTILRYRTAIIKIVSIKNGYVLDTIYVKQSSFVSGLRFTEDVAGTHMAYDRILPDAAGSFSFYVYNPAPDSAWEVMKHTSANTDWYSLNVVSGTTTSLITVTYDENTYHMAKEITLHVKYSDSLFYTQYADSLQVIIAPYTAKSVMTLAAGSPGTWNANMDFLNATLGYESTSYSGETNESDTSLADSRTKKIRYSKGNIGTHLSGYRIDTFAVPNDLVEKDDQNNHLVYLALNYERTMENFSKWNGVYRNEQSIYNIEAAASYEGVQSGSFIAYKGDRETIYSSALVEGAISAGIKPMFKTTMSLFADDANDQNSYSLQRDSEGRLLSSKYLGNGLCSVTLHNVYDRNRISNSSAFFNYDEYQGTGGTELSSFPGNFNPMSNSVPGGSSPTAKANKLITLRGRDFARINPSSEVKFYFGQIAKDPVTIIIKDAGYLPSPLLLEDEQGVRHGSDEYSYEIVSIGKYSDSGKSIPDDAIYSLITDNARNKKWKDDELNMVLKVTYIDSVTITTSGGDVTHGPTTYYLSWISMLYLSKKRRILKGVLKIILYVVLSIVLIIVTWGSGTHTVLAWLYFAVTTVMTGISIYNTQLNKKRVNMLSAKLEKLMYRNLLLAANSAGHLVDLIVMGKFKPGWFRFASIARRSNKFQRSVYWISDKYLGVQDAVVNFVTDPHTPTNTTPNTQYTGVGQSTTIISIAIYIYSTGQELYKIFSTGPDGYNDRDSLPFHYAGGIAHEYFFTTEKIT